MLDDVIDGLEASGRMESFKTEYSLLKTDTDRVKYSIQLMLDYSVSVPQFIILKAPDASRVYRKAANNLFTIPSSKPLLDESLMQYTKSIAHAKYNSEELSLVYADRSAALFKARLYQDCLLDISRALALPYPDNLRAKLYARQARCLLTSEISSKA